MESNNNTKTAKAPSKKTIYIIVGVVTVIAAIVIGMVIANNNKQTNSYIQSAVDDIYDWSDKTEFPTLAEDDYMWKTGGRFEQIRDNKKFSAALCDKMREICTTKKDDQILELNAETISYVGVRRAYQMAAILEYLGYENEEVKACLDELTAMVVEKARNSDNWNNVTAYIYRNITPYKGLKYYTSRVDAISDAEIEKSYADQWKKIKGQMSGGADLENYLEKVVEVVNVRPIEVPSEIKRAEKNDPYAVGSEQNAPSDTSTMAAGITPSLDINNIIPYDELVDALSKYGEKAVFRSGEGGYYDGQKEGRGDFKSDYVSGKVQRTGEEDDFTEKYLQQHYDKPSKTYYYFRDERVSKFPPFYTDTKSVYVYDSTAYAVTDYAVYMGDSVLVYDSEKAKESAGHMTVGDQEYFFYEIESVLSKSVLRSYRMSYRYEYNEKDKLLTLYVKAPEGTTAALLEPGEKRVPLGGTSYVPWEDFKEKMCDLSDGLSWEISWGNQVGVGVIVVSDVDPDSGLLSVLEGEVIQDNSDNPPSPVQTETPETEPTDDEESEER